MPKGKFLYNINADSGNVSDGNSTGTATNSHTLTTSQIPSHSHNYGQRLCVWDAGKSGTNAAVGSYGATSIQFFGWGSVPNTDAAGGGSGHSHNIPYFTCYVWKRTA